MLRAFDHIGMEKARYKFLIIINYYSDERDEMIRHEIEWSMLSCCLSGSKYVC